jgi:hypothetical protein
VVTGRLVVHQRWASRDMKAAVCDEDGRRIGPEPLLEGEHTPMG